MEIKLIIVVTVHIVRLVKGAKPVRSASLKLASLRLVKLARPIVFIARIIVAEIVHNVSNVMITQRIVIVIAVMIVIKAVES
jgi:hypothetical protein